MIKEPLWQLLAELSSPVAYLLTLSLADIEWLSLVIQPSVRYSSGFEDMRDAISWPNDGERKRIYRLKKVE